MIISIILEVKETSLNKHLQKGFSGVRKGESTTPYYVLLISQRPSHWNPSQLKDMHVYQKGPGSDKIWEMKQDDWPKEKRPRRCSHITNLNYPFRDPHQTMYTLVWMGSSACLLSNSVPILLFQSSCKTLFFREVQSKGSATTHQSLVVLWLGFLVFTQTAQVQFSGRKLRSDFKLPHAAVTLSSFGLAFGS